MYYGQESKCLLKHKENLKEFAIGYEPRLEEHSIILPKLPLSVRKSLRILYDHNCNEVKIYTALIVLKIYLAHLKCCNQAYEIRKTPYSTSRSKNLILYYALKYDNDYNLDSMPEYIPSSFIYDHIKAGVLQINEPNVIDVVEKIDKALNLK
ncbi:MAG: hypothetical protein CVU05_14260 [Bacteroidetes bacterium HGW-Bacteroidetes-21]|nr:MAG: hypothetical protein CVU05_14260 [Bacteroidetes bacterium HGW-Bacteroidetes-21]